MRSILPSLGISMVSSPRIDVSSLWFLKGDLSATFADPFELITINFLNGDQPEKCAPQRSSAFLLMATEAALRASSPHKDMGNSKGWSFLEVVRVFFLFCCRSPRP
ncbi:hypothetical protein PoB_006843300 [Plakobranchus ocellatus]|uniref:Uncharacterized protein n=1 Tax=Plakobranchus ocellatus TaxID=259542 RepID=A0AAV4DCH6_9GAST|nr:hypothetical protein PoB_006843300 [Plakobranchus ocellatus]